MACPSGSKSAILGRQENLGAPLEPKSPVLRDLQNILSDLPVFHAPFEQKPKRIFVHIEVAATLLLKRTPNLGIFALLEIRGTLPQALQEKPFNRFIS